MIAVPESAQPYIEEHRGTSYDVFGPECKTFADSIQVDFDRISSFLPKDVDRILDIGCGLAGIDVLLKQRYPHAQLWLIDGDGDEERRGWNEKLGAFSSRAAADELLAANGVAADRWIDVNTNEVLRADLVISLASWGFHYPLSTYEVYGYCIADLRKGQEKVRGTVIGEYQKFNRCAWSQKPINATGYRLATVELAKREEPRVVVEVGVYAGALSKLLSAVPSVKEYYIVDSWQGGYSKFDQAHMDRIANEVTDWAVAHPHVKIYRMDSAKAANFFADECIDFFHTDGDHSLAGIKADIMNWQPKVRVGGVLSGDNYEAPMVAQGVDELLPHRELLANGRLWWARK